MKKKLFFLMLVVMTILLVGCADKEEETADSTAIEPTDEVTLYYSNSTEWADPIIQEFEDQTGVRVNLVQDGTSSLFARIRAEAANPQADVVWGGVIDTYRANQNLLQQYTPSTSEALKGDAVDPNGYYTGFDMGPMVMIYNTELVGNAPTQWADLLDPKYKGQIASADPTASSSSFACLMSIILAYGTDDGKGYAFIEDFVANLDGKVIGSSSGVPRGVADGEYMVGLTYEEAALRYIESGAAIGIVYPEEGTSSSPSGCAIVKDSKNLINAQKFIDYLTSEEVQSQLGNLNRRSVRVDVPDPDTMEAWENINFVEMDIDWTAANTDDFVDRWTDFITQ